MSKVSIKSVGVRDIRTHFEANECVRSCSNILMLLLKLKPSAMNLVKAQACREYVAKIFLTILLSGKNRCNQSIYLIFNISKHFSSNETYVLKPEPSEVKIRK